MMQSLFAEPEQKKQYLSILYNDEAYEGEIQHLFDASKYDKLFICTFVSSPKYFFKQTQAFDEVELLLGIEDNDNAQKYLFDPKYTNEFFKSLDKTTLEKIASDKIRIRFASVGSMIHSKIYILVNSDLNASRVMIGSANYSASAFGNTKQFEELLVYDSEYNKKFADFYIQRYDEIRANTLDFVPQRVKQKIVSQEMKIITLDNEESLELLKDRMDAIQGVVVLPDNLDESIKTTKQIIAQAEESTKQELRSIAKTKQIIEILTKPSKGKMGFIKPAQFIKQKEQIITKVLQEKTIVKEFQDSRTQLIYIEANAHIFLKNDSNEELFLFPKRINQKMLQQKLQLLEKFISAYTTYTINKEGDTKKRIFESILYAFSSVYIWRLREEAVNQQGRDEVKDSIPVFMLIAGMSNSGKTHLIKFISQIMGNHGVIYAYKKSAKLHSMRHINPQLISQFFYEENVTPIFVDEIEKEYYSSNSSTTSGYMGESFIKSTTNTKDGHHPCMIATSNTDFSANSQVMRRMYYIQLNNPFDIDKKEETAEYFTTILNEFGIELYQDFLARLDEKFMKGIKIDVNDILAPAREVFLDCFKELDVQTPSYFSYSRIDDYYIRGKVMWRDLYTIKFKGFKEDKKEGVILLDDEYVFGTKMSANREKRELLQFLPIGVLREEKGIVRLDYQKFFTFIEMRSKNDGFLKSFFGG